MCPICPKCPTIRMAGLATVLISFFKLERLFLNRFFLKKVAKKFGEGKMFDVSLHRLSKFSKTSVRL